METAPSSARIALKWGLIGGLASIIISTGMYMTELWKSPLASIIPVGVLILFLFLAIKEYKGENHGFLTIGEGIGVGTLAAAIQGIISALYSQVYMKFIDANFMEKMKEFQYDKMEEQGLPEEQIEMAIKISDKFMSPGVQFATAVIFSVLIGLVISLIISAVLKKNKPVF